ncbi:GNAT family N-acetyltransferase [Streptomyces sp. NPDC050504]|uniref:GNAT family N-acetyltransferase n=1 Tax=Streptomyces sp. NPDC050504 TaxID=3365618 RepID=UPI00379CDE2A
MTSADRLFADSSDAVRAWVEGWIVSRGAAEPLEQPWGLTVDVGLVRHATRHVLTHADEETVRKLAEAYAAPAVSLKVFLEPEAVLPLLSPEWVSDGPGWLMVTDLRPEAAEPPAGYHVRTWERGGVVRLLVTSADGGFAARGQIAPTGATAVADQIETSPAHRRKGLGSFVMRTLQTAAAERGARVGVLGATTDGKGLYESLGWRIRLPLVGVTYTPTTGEVGS